MDNFYTVSIQSYYWNHNKYPSSDIYVSELLKGIRTEQHNFVLVCNILWESSFSDKIDVFKELYKSFKKYKIKTITIMNSYMKYLQVDFEKEFDTKICYVDYFLWRTYDRVINLQRSQANKKWNSHADKFLFLTGKPDRPHRIRLLWKLRSHLQNCIWSLHINKGLIDECRKQIPELDQKKFEDFINTYRHNPDDVVVDHQEQSLHYGGIPYDVSIFEQSLFRIVSETHFNQNSNAWITEKTWLTILNKCPFIIAGDNGILAKLQQMGFKTFETYLPIKDYDSILNKENKLNAICTNAIHWLTNIENKEAIDKDVEHNYRQLVSLAKHNKGILEKVCENIGIDNTRINEICNTQDFLSKV